MLLVALALMMQPNPYAKYGPAKMVVVTASGVAVTEYKSGESCRLARDELLSQWKSEAEQGLPSGYRVVIPAAFHVFCIPA